MMSSTGVATRVHPSALARESSPREMASDTLDSEGTRWKSGDHEGGLGEEGQATGQAGRLVGRETVSGQRVVDLPKDLFRPLCRGRELDALRSDRQLHPLNHVALGWGLCLGGLRLKPEEGEEVGDGVVGGVGDVPRVHAVEVVDEVAQQHQDKGAQEHLHGVRGSVKVPDARMAKWNQSVTPEAEGRKVPGWGRRMPPWWRCGRSVASPRRSLSSPCSSTWQMAKERAAKQSPGGGWRRTPMPSTEGRATVGTDQ